MMQTMSMSMCVCRVHVSCRSCAVLDRPARRASRVSKKRAERKAEPWRMRMDPGGDCKG